MATHEQWVKAFVLAAIDEAQEKSLPFVGAHSQYTGMEDQFRVAFGTPLYTIDQSGKASGPLMELAASGKVVIRESIARRAGTTARAGEFVGYTVYLPDRLPTQNRVVISENALAAKIAEMEKAASAS